MDEKEYKEVYASVNGLRCPFEKAVLTRMFACRKLVKINIAEREAAGCTDAQAQRQCSELLERLRHDAAFLLKLTHVTGPLPHAKEVKVQCGGLLGLQDCVVGPSHARRGVPDIYGLIEEAKNKFGDLAHFPHQEIIQSVARYEGRRKRRSDRGP